MRTSCFSHLWSILIRPQNSNSQRKRTKPKDCSLGLQLQPCLSLRFSEMRVTSGPKRAWDTIKGNNWQNEPRFLQWSFFVLYFKQEGVKKRNDLVDSDITLEERTGDFALFFFDPAWTLCLFGFFWLVFFLQVHCQ